MSDIAPHSRSSLLSGLPLLALALIAYNAAIWAGHDFTNQLSDELMHVRLISGADWTAGWNEALLIAALGLLFIEILKATRSTVHSAFEHVLSMFVFIIFIVEFLIVPAAGTNTFLLLGLMSLIDVMGGYAISIAVARKEMNLTT